jgi:hypothetical protein
MTKMFADREAPGIISEYGEPEGSPVAVEAIAIRA